MQACLESSSYQQHLSTQAVPAVAAVLHAKAVECSCSLLPSLSTFLGAPTSAAFVDDTNLHAKDGSQGCVHPAILAYFAFLMI